MNSVFSLSKRDSDDENPVADSSESNSESKTDEQNGSDGEKDQNSPGGSKTEEEAHTEPKRDEDILGDVVPIDDLERDDFEAENRILNSCNEVGRERRTPNRESRPDEDDGPPGSRTPLFSGIPRYDLPGCSNSNDTIRNMMRRKPLYPVEAPPKKKPVISPDGTPLQKLERPVVRPTFMQRLLSSNVAEAKDIPRGKLYKAEIADCICEGRDISDSYSMNGRTSSDGSSSSDNSKDFSVPSTSNADKLLGLDKKDEPSGSSSTSEEYKYYKDDESDDESSDVLCCTCLSSHEDEDDEDEEEPGVDERLWRKRRGEPQSPQEQKKFCTEESPVPCEEENYPVSNPSSSFSSPGSSSHMYGLPEVKQWLQKFLSWPDNEKDEALDQLIGRCSVGQVRYMMKSIEPLLQRDFISLLPKEVALTVLGYLEPKDLARAARTCRYWRFLADDNLLWKDQCRRIGITTLDKKTRTGIASSVSPWKAAYMRQYLIEDNWLHKPVSNAKVMRGHDDHVITCLQFCGNRILSGSDDTTLKIWSSVTGKCLRTLRGHTGGVWSSQMVGDLVISGSTDRTLRIWNANTGRCLNILMGHSSTVRCMHLYKKRVVSGSRDTTLRVWSIPGGKCLSVLSGHLAAVRCVQYDGKVVVSGAYDYYVKVWNPETGECLHTLAGHKNRVYSLQFDGVHAVSGSLDTTICVWDVASGKLKRTLTGHQSLTSGMELQSNILVSGNADSTVKVWNIATGHCLHTLSGPNKHQSAVTCLQTSNRFVITSSDDGTVKLWDIRTGEFLRNLVELGSGGSGGVVWRIRASATKLICAVGSRNGTEETKLLLLNFDVPGVCEKCKK